MTVITLSNEEKSINITLSNSISLEENGYKINPPIISCNKARDAIQMQTKINEFISNLGKEIINE